MMDFKVPLIGPWYCFYQTNPSNTNDGDCFVRTSTGQLGVGGTGYSSEGILAETWYRMIINVDNLTGLYDIYLDTRKILQGSAGFIDGRFALAPTLLLFADDNGEDAPLLVSMVAIYNRPLTQHEIDNLGDAYPDDPTNQPPQVTLQAAGISPVNAGISQTYQFAATDANNDTVSFLIDWGDGTITSWSTLAPVSSPYLTTHTYDCAGSYPIRVTAKDEHGSLSTQVEVQTIVVQGECVPVFLTAPYLQNVKPNGITILWELDRIAPCTVEFGLTVDYGSSVIATRSDSGNQTSIYRVTLADLLPFQIYHYRVITGVSPGPDYTFRTGTEEPLDFSFSVWADSQGTNHGTYPQDPYEPTKAMLRHMNDDPQIHFGTTSGDLAENGNAYTDTHVYYLDRVAKLLGRFKPWFVAWGNHDAGSTGMIRKFADLPSQERTDLIGSSYPTAGWGSYSFNYADCHFIMLDVNTYINDMEFWLVQDLQSQDNQNARFTFLFIHYPPYCEVWIDGDSYARSVLVPLMQTYGVDVCFSGHTHGYMRGYLNGVFYCITGGGSWLDTSEPLTTDWQHMTVGGYHPLAIDVSSLGLGGAYGMINEYVKVSVSGNNFNASGLGFKPNGDFFGVIDEFGISNNPPTPTPTNTQVFTPTPTRSATPTPTPTEHSSLVRFWSLLP
jgi:hypothetical protein